MITDEMYPMLRRLVDEVVLVSEEEVIGAMRRLAINDKLVTEGAGAASVAAALATPAQDRGLSVCIVSGGSVDPVRPDSRPGGSIAVHRYAVP